MAFNQLDITCDGLVNMKDLKRLYSAAKHPKVLSKQQTEEQCLRRFIGRFDGAVAEDGMVRQVTRALHNW